jgi:hypothetical protein
MNHRWLLRRKQFCQSRLLVLKLIQRQILDRFDPILRRHAAFRQNLFGTGDNASRRGLLQLSQFCELWRVASGQYIGRQPTQRFQQRGRARSLPLASRFFE